MAACQAEPAWAIDMASVVIKQARLESSELSCWDTDPPALAQFLVTRGDGSEHRGPPAAPAAATKAVVLYRNEVAECPGPCEPHAPRV